MGASSSQAFTDQTGVSLEELATSSLAKFDPKTQQISFFPTPKPSPFYEKLQSSPPFITYLSPAEIKSAVLEYTNHETGFCTKLNWLLASGVPSLLDQGPSIKKLDFAITALARKFPAKSDRTYRGLWLNETEFEAYPIGKFIYIPSFMSTSRNPKKFYRNPKINCLIIVKIECHPLRAFEVGEEFSKYYKQEEETLFSCYNKFKVENKICGFEFAGEKFEFGLVLAAVNEDLTKKDAKILAVLNCM